MIRLSTLDLELVATFLAVAEAGSFGKAASRRDLSQGAVSQQVGKLERRLGARLVVRSPKVCTLTPAGSDFAGYARALLRLSQRAQKAVRQRSAMVGASSNIGVYLLQPYLKRFLENHPETGLQAHIASNPELARLLEDGELDVALMEWWDDRPGFKARIWRREPLVAIAARGHPWSKLPQLPPSLLRRTPLLGGEPGTGTGRILADYLGADGGQAASQTLGSTEAVKRWVKAGLGVSVVLAGTVAAEVESGCLCAIPLAGEAPSKSLYLVWRDGLLPASPTHEFVDWLDRGN